ncbi:hypothetical protein Flexsi_1336 [Flexistipes sinusarabici DSM 4947]|uniref:Uncharacterized protein n=1 Tax=Flexistipes sinusarabici (strain ATCC 49648 / DSM 4947 / MAS 10) TaxID=717231 RepID=F8E7K0_FLESM|nr:hypothetical protein Flexsi_1336 [Flexistipes sinusarabici DSM 4947]
MAFRDKCKQNESYVLFYKIAKFRVDFRVNLSYMKLLY